MRVGGLAGRTEVSPSTFARRFAHLVGEAPLTYLTRWRMTLAADLLVERKGATVADIARTVGYSDPFGFSAAFKRARGTNPGEFRRSAAALSPAADEQPVSASV
ncbi:AraC-like DNA-binding protein [Lipingzhangella halophila]|uniref:AraC-like DNA-binding protein n=1 Tax=Lipingzhangella halophila TaxID=1783352 RepID=A0A7W7W672_9ACTN|nr:helix-turn-helix transcriptional regulator [Lipingzhangella halophila]MBB4935446.1 AraC-like DNA-binding protein [Lipingzhangella halophila]